MRSGRPQPARGSGPSSLAGPSLCTWLERGHHGQTSGMEFLKARSSVQYSTCSTQLTSPRSLSHLGSRCTCTLTMCNCMRPVSDGLGPTFSACPPRYRNYRYLDVLNRLRLNPDKTQYIWFGTRQRLKNRDIRGLTALSSSLVETSSVRDLGVILDSELTMEEHVIKLCQTCFFHLRRIRSVRRSLTSQALNTLVHAFISSRIDFCNGVLCGISGYLIDRLQSVLNRRQGWY